MTVRKSLRPSGFPAGPQASRRSTWLGAAARGVGRLLRPHLRGAGHDVPAPLEFPDEILVAVSDEGIGLVGGGGGAQVIKGGRPGPLNSYNNSPRPITGLGSPLLALRDKEGRGGNVRGQQYPRGYPGCGEETCAGTQRELEKAQEEGDSYEQANARISSRRVQAARVFVWCV